ncbi:MAG TPA: glutathione S-transferase family protein [Arenimonas sp.]|uniref:glutathione S-transferase family protein n=1 Tax=Arenimonas sp. TaxID=1872635 RepID=UPI002D80AFBC|nr:glutathione S-transferase family protein [Arenimonas sp.]HEU0153175.1 glutathione S-transferase family protein [Arenimonas sp.]
MFTLYYAPGACSLSVHIVMEWLKEPYNAIKVDPSSDEFRKLNPAGQVPTFITPEKVTLTQCAAILRYLSRRFPAAKLADDSSPESSAETERWSAFLTGDLHPAFFPVFMPGRYTVATDDESLKNVKAAGLDLVRKKLAILDAVLQDRPFYTGRERSYVDAYSVPMVRWATKVLPEGLKGYPNVKNHHEHMLADPAVVRAMTAEGLLGS